MKNTFKVAIVQERQHPYDRKWNELALQDDSKYIQEFCDIAKELKIGIVITGFTKGVERPQNSAFLIDKRGKIIMKYSKVHTCDFASERMLECGDEFKVCNFEGIKIGIMICYDREYPESARILMLKGAEGIFIAKYDLDKLRDYRSHEMMGNTFRKVQAYSELLNDDIQEPFKR